jgi:hypothetical protein
MALVRCAKASAGRVPSAAILGMEPPREASAKRGSISAVALSALWPGIGTSCRLPLLPSMMVTVLPAGAAGGPAVIGGPS